MSGRREVAVLDHGMGNLRSVAKALEAAGAETVVTSDPRRARAAGALCVPGQGVFGRCIESMTSTGLDDLVRGWVSEQRPLLGICLGLQVLFESSTEGGGYAGLGLLGGTVRRIEGGIRIPHIGWNTLTGNGADASPRPYFYFDHSYAAFPSDPSIVSGWCEHGERWAASVTTGPILAVQFHPEKSGREGISLLRSWVEEL